MKEFSFAAVEKSVSSRCGSYPGLAPEALLTSKADYLSIFKALPDIQLWIEPGSGHGLGPLLFAELFSERQAIGLEYEKSRYEYSELLKDRSGLSNVEFICTDLLETTLPIGDTYFLYFPTGMVLDRILHQLMIQARPVRIIAIESHGDLIPRLRKESWLEQTSEIPLQSQRHYPNAVVFEGQGPGNFSLNEVSFLERYLEIEDSHGALWIGESLGLEWAREEEYNLLTPPRSITSGQVKRIIAVESISAVHLIPLKLRKLGELQIETTQGNFKAHLRKIYVSSTFKVELSTGQQVEWSYISKIYWENHLCYDSSLGYCSFPHAASES